jgi:hypothetical protein
MLAEVTGIRLPGPPPEHPEPADATDVIGTFRGRDLAVELTVNESGHVLVTEQLLADELKSRRPKRSLKSGEKTRLT